MGNEIHVFLDGMLPKVFAPIPFISIKYIICHLAVQNKIQTTTMRQKAKAILQFRMNARLIFISRSHHHTKKIILICGDVQTDNSENETEANSRNLLYWRYSACLRAGLRSRSKFSRARLRLKTITKKLAPTPDQIGPRLHVISGNPWFGQD